MLNIIKYLGLLVDRIMRKWYPMSSEDNDYTPPTAPERPEVVDIPISAPTTLETPVLSEKHPSVADFCNAIALFEGGVGDANHRNCNPGNARWNPGGYLPMYGVVRKSKNGFAIFKDWNTGMLYLNNMVKGQIHKRPDSTILQFMQRYAPVGDDNSPEIYSVFIAKRLSTSTSFLMKNLV